MVEKKQKGFIIAIFFVTIVKLILMGMFSSDYQDLMFIPFVAKFIEGYNPYDYFNNNTITLFPYPPLMLFIESMFGIISLQTDNIFLTRLFFKIPLLIFDFVGLIYLKKICNLRLKYLFVLYFCSPIILFSTFMHGQLDIIPTIFLIISIYYVTRSINKRDIYLSGLFLGCALATKLHILAVIPIILLYIIRKYDVKTTLIFFIEVLSIFLLFVLPFWCDGLIQAVLKNKEQAAIFDVFINFNSAKILVVVFAVCVLYIKVFELLNISKELLLSIVGVLFSVFLMCVSPMPGWFVWVVPYMYIFFVSIYNKKHKLLLVYAFLNIMYLLYFVLCQKTGFVTLYAGVYSMEFMKINSVHVSDTIFSVMTALQMMIIYNMYQFGMASNNLYKRSSTPFTIGISGDSGTGKSELLSNLEDTLGITKILHIEGDGDHRWERGSDDWEYYTHLDPRANFLYRQADDIRILRAGSKVSRVDYNHSTGKFTAPKIIKPKPYIILCGLHSLFLPQLRETLDLKIYMDTDETLRRFWKIKRDISKRGYNVENIIKQIEKRIPDAKKYIYPQKKYANFIISYFDPNLREGMDLSYDVSLCLKVTISININIEQLVMQLRAYGVDVLYEYNENLFMQTLIIDDRNSKIEQKDFINIAEKTVYNYLEMFHRNIYWRVGLDGILQLIILIVISNNIRGIK